MYRGCTTDSLHPTPRLNQQEFYSSLAEELIDNNLQQMRTRQRVQRNTEERMTASDSATDFINLVPQLRATPKKKRNRYGEAMDYCSQGRCRVCYKGRPTTICSACQDNDNVLHYFCDPRTGRNCFEIHVEDVHM